MKRKFKNKYTNYVGTPTTQNSKTNVKVFIFFFSKIRGENDYYQTLLELQMRLDQKAELFKHTSLKDIQIIQVHQQHRI